MREVIVGGRRGGQPRMERNSLWPPEKNSTSYASLEQFLITWEVIHAVDDQRVDAALRRGMNPYGDSYKFHETFPNIRFSKKRNREPVKLRDWNIDRLLDWGIPNTSKGYA
jgi:hypothetical protein